MLYRLVTVLEPIADYAPVKARTSARRDNTTQTIVRSGLRDGQSMWNHSSLRALILKHHGLPDSISQESANKIYAKNYRLNKHGEGNIETVLDPLLSELGYQDTDTKHAIDIALADSKQLYKLWRQRND